ncbi:hypothetical protein [Halomonas sp. C05BenzN]|uniref:hypothetical protein n=1 Tax=Halomonas sp. C05BenzN TaxID=3411041 RepID=UPI003B943B96
MRYLKYAAFLSVYIIPLMAGLGAAIVVAPYFIDAVLGEASAPFPARSFFQAASLGVAGGVMTCAWLVGVEMIAGIHSKRFDSDYPSEGRVIQDMDNTMLFLSEDGEIITPFHAYHLKVPRGKRKTLPATMENAMIVPLEGPIRTLHNTKVIGPWGVTKRQRFFSRLCSAWIIDVEMRDTRITFDSVKEEVVRRLEKNENYIYHFGISKKDLEHKVNLIWRAGSMKQLFSVFGLVENDTFNKR